MVQYLRGQRSDLGFEVLLGRLDCGETLGETCASESVSCGDLSFQLGEAGVWRVKAFSRRLRSRRIGRDRVEIPVLHDRPAVASRTRLSA